MRHCTCVLSGVEIKLVFQSSAHLLPFACYYFPIGAFEGFVMRWAGPCVFLMFPYTPDVWMFCWALDVFAEPISVNQGSMLNLVPDSPENLQVSFPGWLLVLGKYVAWLCGRVSWVDIATKLSCPRLGVGSQSYAVRENPENFPLCEHSPALHSINSNIRQQQLPVRRYRYWLG